MAWTNDPTNTPSTGLSAVPANGGTGFLAWTSSKTATTNTGYFRGNASGAGYANLNSTDGTAFGMYANPLNSFNSAYAYRKPINSLMNNGILSVTLGVNYRNGFKGVTFLKAGVPSFSFDISNDLYRYRFGGSLDYRSGTWTNWSIAYNASSVFRVTFQRVDPFATANIFRINTSDDTGLLANNTVSRDIDEIRFYVDSTESSIVENNLYFNFLSAYNAFRL